VVLRRYITGLPTEEDMEIIVDTISLRVPVGQTTVLVKNLYLSCDPRMLFAHEHVTCAPGDERDAQDTSQGESRRERDTQDTPARALETRHPTLPGGTPSGRTAAMGCPRSA
jgi:hypothetical protein